MQPCQEYEALISAAIDGEVTEEERRTLMEHLPWCEGCREAYTQSLLLHEAFDQWEEEAPAGLAEAVMEQVHREPRKRSRSRSRHWMSLAAAAACLALIVVGFQVGQTMRSPAADPKEDNTVQSDPEGSGAFSAAKSADKDAAANSEQEVQDPEPQVDSAMTQYDTGKVEPPVQAEAPQGDQTPEQNTQTRAESPQVTMFTNDEPVMTVTCSDAGILTWMEENITQEGTASGEETVWVISDEDWMKLEVRLLDGGCTYTVEGKKTSDEIVDGDLVRVIYRPETEA